MGTLRLLLPFIIAAALAAAAIWFVLAAFLSMGTYIEQVIP